MRICDKKYYGDDITQLRIKLKTSSIQFGVNLVKPDMPSYTVGELKQPNQAELIFDDSRDLDTFIEAMLQLQRHYRESTGEWRFMR